MQLDIALRAARALGLTVGVEIRGDGGTDLEGVEVEAWRRLAGEVGFAPRFLAQRMEPFVSRAREAAEELAGEDQHRDPVVEEIVGGVCDRAERFSATVTPGG